MQIYFLFKLYKKDVILVERFSIKTIVCLIKQI